MRTAIVNDGSSWFVRRIASSRHDLTNDEMIYTCDKPIAGPFNSLPQAVEALQLALAEWHS